MADEKQLGPTGGFPDGKLGPGDKGAIKISLSTVGSYVILDLGPAGGVAMNADEAERMAISFIKCSIIARASEEEHGPNAPIDQLPSAFRR